MSPREVADAIQAFFDRVRVAHITLPEGSFGRPGDNLYQLDDQILVTISGDARATLRTESSREELVVDGYSQVIFAPLLYGTDRPSKPTIYEAGELTFGAQPSRDIGER